MAVVSVICEEEDVVVRLLLFRKFLIRENPKAKEKPVVVHEMSNSSMRYNAMGALAARTARLQNRRDIPVSTEVITRGPRVVRNNNGHLSQGGEDLATNKESLPQVTLEASEIFGKKPDWRIKWVDKVLRFEKLVRRFGKEGVKAPQHNAAAKFKGGQGPQYANYGVPGTSGVQHFPTGGKFGRSTLLGDRLGMTDYARNALEAQHMAAF